MKKILRINLNTKTFNYEAITSPYSNLGGRGLTSNIICNEVPPKADPLGKENKLVIAPGILAGTIAPNNGRISIGAKSPLTGTIKETNAGGTVAQKLARLGIAAIVLEGISENLILVKIDRYDVRFIEADNLKGIGNYELIDRLKGGYGDNIGIVSIGPAGEMKLKAANISVTTPDFKIRAAARGGLGAVMGSKNLKALVIDDTEASGVEVSNPELLKDAVSGLTKGILSHPLIEGLKVLGTPILVMMINAASTLPTKNYSMGQFADAERISGEHMVEVMSKRPGSNQTHRCMNGCIIGCSNVYTDEGGKEIVSGLEYETIGMVGSNCMINNLDDIALINRLCNDIGLDTMDVGAAIACAMEAGIISWGDGKSAYAIIGDIRSDKGMMIGNGCLYTGKHLGVSRIPQVKGQSLAAYDPRVLKGTGVTYATSTMGADHTCGNALPSPANPEYNPTAPTGQGPMSSFLQRYFAAIDSLGFCLFASLPLLDIPDLQKSLINCACAITGIEYNENYLLELGAEVLRIEKKFNDMAGFTSKDDRLPEFFSKEQLPGPNTVFDVPEEEIVEVLKF
ncbi:MAG TPA: aldehyde ferredoxin oxidoreductase C-terminal domain-containing protein [Syntrophorhabdaceae bacterium]|nr:aldehyde ferredoxin oxidoreductase C-terminal domain-containing protein [Syntrophorhabdaceae bacterium]